MHNNLIQTPEIPSNQANTHHTNTHQSQRIPQTHVQRTQEYIPNQHANQYVQPLLNDATTPQMSRRQNTNQQQQRHTMPQIHQSSYDTMSRQNIQNQQTQSNQQSQSPHDMLPQQSIQNQHTHQTLLNDTTTQHMNRTHVSQHANQAPHISHAQLNAYLQQFPVSALAALTTTSNTHSQHYPKLAQSIRAPVPNANQQLYPPQLVHNPQTIHVNTEQAEQPYNAKQYPQPMSSPSGNTQTYPARERRDSRKHRTSHRHKSLSPKTSSSSESRSRSRSRSRSVTSLHRSRNNSTKDHTQETTSTSNKDIETPTLQEQLREARSQAKTFAAVNRLLQEQLQQTKAELQNKHSQLQIKEQELKNARNQLNELNAKYITDLKQQLSTSHDTSSDSDSSEATEGKRRSKRTLKKKKKKKEKPQIPKKTLFADLPASIRQRLRTNWNDGHMTFTHKETETAFDANTWHRNEALTVETLCRQFDFAAVIRFCMKHKIGVIQSRTTNSGTGLPTTKMANCVWICLNGLANAGHIQWLGSAVGGDIFKELSSKPSKPLSENEKKDAGNAMIDFMDIQLYDIPFSSANLKKPNNQDNNNNSNNNNDINPANLNPAQQTIETNQKNAET
eukprot:95471_1